MPNLNEKGASKASFAMLNRCRSNVIVIIGASRKTRIVKIQRK